MVANLTLAAFLGGLVVSLVFGFPLVCALLFGLVLFIAYARYLKVSVRKIALLLAVGVKKLKNILIIFTLIGFLTALWRACGTIPFIVFYGMKLISPPFFLVSVFGRDLHDHGKIKRSFPRAGRRRSSLRNLFRRPLFSHVIQRQPGGFPDGNKAV